MALFDKDGQLGSLGKFGMMLQSFADPTIIPAYQKQQIEMQDRQMKLDEINRMRQREADMQELVARASGTGAVPTSPGTMGPLQPQPAMSPLDFLAQAAKRDPQFIDDYINLQAQESDPMRNLQMQKLQMEINKLGRPPAATKEDRALEFLANIQQPVQGGQAPAGLADFDTMMQQDGFLPSEQTQPAGDDIQKVLQTSIALEALGISDKMQEKIMPKLVPGFSAVEEGQKQEEVSDVLGGIYANYENLADMGRITSAGAGAVNIGPGLSSTPAGQFVGRLFGTKAQSERNQIVQSRPILIQAIKNATGMSAQQMNSNVELQNLLRMATDPALDVQANMAAVERIDNLYGTGVLKNPYSGSGGGSSQVEFLGFE